MRNQPLTLLVIEDNLGDFVLLEEYLQLTDLHFSAIEQASYLAKGIEAALNSKPDVIFLDLFLPDSRGLESFAKLNVAIPDVPIIVLSGLNDTKIALDAIANGAQDFLVKGEFSAPLLQKAVQYSIERKETQKKLEESNRRYEMVSKATHDSIWDWDLKTGEVLWNENLKKVFGYSLDEPRNGAWYAPNIHPGDSERVKKKLQEHLDKGLEQWSDEFRFRCADGSYKCVFDRGYILYDENHKPYRLIGAMQDITQLKRLQQRLIEEAENKQKELAKATLEGQEKEKNELGKELHDNINQILAAIKLYLDMASSRPEVKDQMIQFSREKITYCIEEIRRLSKSLLPPTLGKNNLPCAINDVIDTISTTTDISIHKNINEKDFNLLTDTQQINIYRIIQEQLNNIVKHAHAKNVFIAVGKSNNHIDLLIKDDGRGFDVTRKANGVGLKSMKSRVQTLQGQMEIIAAPQQGCTLFISFPLN